MRTLLAFGCAALLAASCQKENETPFATHLVDSDGAKVGIRGKRHFYDNGGSDYGCKTPALNCLDDVVVTPRLQSMMDDFHAVVRSGDAGAIKGFVEANRVELLGLMSADDLDAIIDGTFSVRSRGSSNDAWYLLLTSTGELSVAYPFRSE